MPDHHIGGATFEALQRAVWTAAETTERLEAASAKQAERLAALARRVVDLESRLDALATDPERTAPHE